MGEKKSNKTAIDKNKVRKDRKEKTEITVNKISQITIQNKEKLQDIALSL